MRREREAKGWTQPEAAKRIEIEQSYLSKIENGHNYPAEDIFEKLVSAYALDINDMGRTIPSAELKKLRDVRKVRKLFLKREHSALHSLRSWLISCLAMLMLGSAILTFELTRPSETFFAYIYKSEGILALGEKGTLQQNYDDTRKEHRRLLTALARLGLHIDVASPELTPVHSTDPNNDAYKKQAEIIKAKLKVVGGKLRSIESRRIDSTVTYNGHYGDNFKVTVPGGRAVSAAMSWHKPSPNNKYDIIGLYWR